MTTTGFYRDAIHRLAQAGKAVGVKLVRVIEVYSVNCYTAGEIEFDTDGTTKLVSEETLTVTNLAEPADFAGQLPADTEATALDVEGRWVIFVKPSAAAFFPAKVIASQGDAAYTVREQSLTVAEEFINKAGASNVTAHNLAELSLGPGAAVDNGTILMVAVIPDNDSPPTLRYYFDHPAYAKYLD